MNQVSSWFALQTRSNSEKRTGGLLRQKGYECFIPTYRQRRKWSDRIVETDLPLFPMYVFCRASAQILGKMISTAGVLRIVGFGGNPAEVAVEEIEALQLLAQSGFLREPWLYLPDGVAARVETGPLAGIQGIICHGDNKRRLIISVTLLQRSVAIHLEDDTIISVVSDIKRPRLGFSIESEMAIRLLSKS